jgi:hypothetical protein
VFGQVEDSSGGAGQADAVVPVVDVFWWHDRASMMHRTVYEPQTRSRSADMQPNPRASSVLPDSTGPAATHDKHGIGGADSRARRKEGLRPHDVSVHAFPNNDQLARAHHRLKLAARDPKFGKLTPSHDPVMSSKPRGEGGMEARHWQPPRQ